MSIRFGFVSSYPPTHCGIATFSASLISAITELDSNTASVVRLLDSPIEEVPRLGAPEIASIMCAGDLNSIDRAIGVLNSRDIAVIQHEFGIYGGPDGEEVLTLLRGLRIPSIVVLHTVLSSPTWHQRIVFTELCRQGSALVTMSLAARERLVKEYAIDRNKIFVIPHGASTKLSVKSKELVDPPMILTWGLIGPGKGIEWAVEAMGRVRDMGSLAHYVVAGRTHPKVLERNGEAYREGLQLRIDELGLTESIQLKADYLSDEALAELVASASIVLLPYDSTEQVTSGVLIEAIAARRPVVATAFPHAVELLADGVGVVVPHRNPDALAEGMWRILHDPKIAQEMSRRASIIAAELLWPVVAVRYVELAMKLIRASAAA